MAPFLIGGMQNCSFSFYIAGYLVLKKPPLPFLKITGFKKWAPHFYCLFSSWVLQQKFLFVSTIFKIPGIRISIGFNNVKSITGQTIRRLILGY